MPRVGRFGPVIEDGRPNLVPAVNGVPLTYEGRRTRPALTSPDAWQWDRQADTLIVILRTSHTAGGPYSRRHPLLRIDWGQAVEGVTAAPVFWRGRALPNTQAPEAQPVPHDAPDAARLAWDVLFTSDAQTRTRLIDIKAHQEMVWLDGDERLPYAPCLGARTGALLPPYNDQGTLKACVSPAPATGLQVRSRSASRGDPAAWGTAEGYTRWPLGDADDVGAWGGATPGGTSEAAWGAYRYRMQWDHEIRLGFPLARMRDFPGVA